MKKTLRTKIIVISALVLLLGFGLFILVTKTPYAIIINGSKTVKVTYGQDYQDPGAHILLGLGKVTTTGSVDTTTLGTYTITYQYREFSRQRTVNVVDDLAPVITLQGNQAYVALDADYLEYGYTVIDNFDGDLSEELDITSDVNTQVAGQYTVTYSVTDSNGNTATAQRNVTVVARQLLTEDAQTFSLDDFFTDTIISKDYPITDAKQTNTVIAGDEFVGSLGYHGVLPLDSQLWTRSQLNPVTALSALLNVEGHRSGTLADQLTATQPEKLLLLMGSTALTTQDPKDLADNYSELIETLRKSSPDTQIIIISVLPVSKDYPEAELFNQKINQANYYLCQVAAQYGLRYLDIASAIKTSDGAMPNEYVTTDFRHLNPTGDLAFKAIIDQFISQ